MREIERVGERGVVMVTCVTVAAVTCATRLLIGCHTKAVNNTIKLKRRHCNLPMKSEFRDYSAAAAYCSVSPSEGLLPFCLILLPHMPTSSLPLPSIFDSYTTTKHNFGTHCIDFLLATY